MAGPSPNGTPGIGISRAKLGRSLIRVQRNKQDGPTADSNKTGYWVGLFNGWEDVDLNLMRVIHTSGNEVRYVPTYYHVRNSSCRFTVGVTPVRVIQQGQLLWVEGVVIGDPTRAPAVN